MSLDEINAIVEGCMPDTPEKLMYASVDFQIPENAKVLLGCRGSYPTRYLLYAKTKDFSGFEVLNNPFFEWKRGFNADEMFKGGIPLKKYEPNFDWIFDAQRALITRDGRIYIQAAYFEENWRWYLKAVPLILKECGEIFRGDKTEEYFIENPSSVH